MQKNTNEPPKTGPDKKIVTISRPTPPEQIHIKSVLSEPRTYTPSRNIGKFKGRQLLNEAPFRELVNALEVDDLNKVLSLCLSETDDIETAKSKVFILDNPAPLLTENEAELLRGGEKPGTCARLSELIPLARGGIASNGAGVVLIDYSFVRELLSEETVKELEKDPQDLAPILYEITRIIQNPTFFSLSIAGGPPLYDFENVINFLGDEDLAQVCMNNKRAFPFVLRWIADMMAAHDTLTLGAIENVYPETAGRLDKLLIIELFGREMFRQALLVDSLKATNIIDLVQSNYYPVEEISKLAKSVNGDADKFLKLEIKIRTNADPNWHPGAKTADDSSAAQQQLAAAKERIEARKDEFNEMFKELDSVPRKKDSSDQEEKK